MRTEFFIHTRRWVICFNKRICSTQVGPRSFEPICFLLKQTKSKWTFQSPEPTFEWLEFGFISTKRKWNWKFKSLKGFYNSNLNNNYRIFEAANGSGLVINSTSSFYEIEKTYFVNFCWDFSFFLWSTKWQNRQFFSTKMIPKRRQQKIRECPTVSLCTPSLRLCVHSVSLFFWSPMMIFQPFIFHVHFVLRH